MIKVRETGWMCERHGKGMMQNKYEDQTLKQSQIRMINVSINSLVKSWRTEGIPVHGGQVCRPWCALESGVQSGIQRRPDRSVLDQVYQNVLWTRASTEEIRHEEYLIFRSKQINIVCHICLHLNWALEIVQNIKYYRFKIWNIYLFQNKS